MNWLLRVESFISKNNFTLLLISFFLVRIPPFYIFFPIKSAFLTTHTFARIIIFILFFFLLIKKFILKKKTGLRKIGKDQKSLLIIFLIFFLFQSFSILGAVNPVSFLQRYKEFIFSGIFLFLLILFKTDYKKIIFVFLATLIFNFFYQMLIFLSPDLFREIGNIIVYQPHLELVTINLERSRIFIETYDEIIIPFLFIMFLSQKEKSNKILVLLLFSAVLFPSFLSNFRSRILMLLLSFLASFLFILKTDTKKQIMFLLTFLIFGYITFLILTRTFGFSFVDRFTMQDEKEDQMTVQLRMNNLNTAIDMGIANPLFGVGLGNYYDNLPSKKKIRLSLFDWRNKESEIASTNPHNIFAQVISETGLISFIFYIFMMIYFLIYDFKKIRIKKNNLFAAAFIISFWTLFSYSLFNPSTTFGFNLIFWTVRGVIHSIG